jgi:serine/threonine-protein kinase
MGEVRLLYVVMEYAEENLSEILPQRPLTPAEARDMLQPVLDALEYLHAKGFVQGRLKPSNIMAVADQVKLSSDGLRALSPLSTGPGSLPRSSASDAPETANGPITPAADVWSLGATLVEVLTLRRPSWDRTGRGATKEPELLLPQGIPDPFRDLVSQCLNPDPQKRWTIAEIAAWLNPPAAVKPEEPRLRPREDVSSRDSSGLVSSAAWLYVAIAVIALVVIWLAATRTRHPHPPAAATKPEPAPSSASEPALVQPESKPSPAVAAPPESSLPNPTSSAAVSSPEQSGAAADSAPARAAKSSPGTIPAEVGERVLPRISQSARNSIQGHVRVSVRVAVDASGNVVEATLDSPGPSKYFARLARDAAGGWKFSPAQVKGRSVPSKWILRFAFSSSGTDVRPTEIAP